MGIGNTANRREVKILLCLIVISPFLLTPWVHGDGLGHFGFLRSSIIDRDLTNEHAYLTTHIKDDAVPVSTNAANQPKVIIRLINLLKGVLL